MYTDKNQRRTRPKPSSVQDPKTASVLDKGREATCNNTQQTASPSILHDEQPPRDPRGWVVRAG